jgi:hypothetical protein
MDRVQPTQTLAPYLLDRSGILEVAACGITALVYVATLSFGFVYDDVPQILKFPEAAENASLAIVRSPNTRGYHLVLGLIFKTAGDRARAAAEFRSEIAEHPNNAAASAELQKLNGVSSAQRP